MNEMTTAITEIKRKVTSQEWEGRIQECQSSGLSVKAWCSDNGITVGSYYFHLRKLRETILEEKQIVPLKNSGTSVDGNIQIESENIRITLPETISPEQLSTVLRVLKEC